MRVKDGEFLVPQVKLAARFKGRLKAWLKAEQPELFKQVPPKVWWMKWVADVQPVGSRRGGVEISGQLSVLAAAAGTPVGTRRRAPA